MNASLIAPLTGSTIIEALVGERFARQVSTTQLRHKMGPRGIRALEEDDVAWQEQAGARVELRGFQRVRSIAAAEDPVAKKVDPELRLEGLRRSICVMTPNPSAWSA